MADGDLHFIRVKALSAATTGARTTGLVLPNCAGHNLREFHSCSDDAATGPIDPSRSCLNIILRGCDTAAGVAQTWRELVRVGGWQKPVTRVNATVAGEIVFSLPATTVIDVVAYFTACVQWAEAYFDAPILSAVVHRDQSHPHCHLLLLPVRGGEWRGGYFFGKKPEIDAMHAAFHEAIGKRFAMGNARTPRASAAARHEAAAQEVAVIRANPALLDAPEVAQALIKLVAADPNPLRAARERLLIEHLQSGNAVMTVPAETKRYPVLAHFHGDKQSTSNTGQGADIGVDDGADPAATLSGHRDDAQVLAGDAFHISQPINIALDDGSAVGQPADDGDFVREHDDALPSDWWDGDLGRHIALPVMPASRRGLADAAVHDALTRMQGRRRASR